jgi:hypothetical protein
MLVVFVSARCGFLNHFFSICCDSGNGSLGVSFNGVLEISGNNFLDVGFGTFGCAG